MRIEGIEVDPEYFGVDDNTKELKQMGFVRSAHGEVWYHPAHWEEWAGPVDDWSTVSCHDADVLKPVSNAAKAWLKANNYEYGLE